MQSNPIMASSVIGEKVTKIPENNRAPAQGRWLSWTKFVIPGLRHESSRRSFAGNEGQISGQSQTRHIESRDATARLFEDGIRLLDK
jgi:hypothetical protein